MNKITVPEEITNFNPLVVGGIPEERGAAAARKRVRTLSAVLANPLKRAALEVFQKWDGRIADSRFRGALLAALQHACPDRGIQFLVDSDCYTPLSVSALDEDGNSFDMLICKDYFNFCHVSPEHRPRVSVAKIRGLWNKRYSQLHASLQLTEDAVRNVAKIRDTLAEIEALRESVQKYADVKPVLEAYGIDTREITHRASR